MPENYPRWTIFTIGLADESLYGTCWQGSYTYTPLKECFHLKTNDVNGLCLDTKILSTAGKDRTSHI